MAKILSFRNRDGGGADQNFLTDENETLSFSTAEDGAVSLGEVSAKSLPSPLPDPRKDWTNQELADLFRVRQLLSGAGVPVDTLRGVTDEGDPWFVYCHLNGDVFIHMARIDGLYVLDSPNVHRPLRGRDFNGLVADFTSDALPTYAKAGAKGDDTTTRVVKFERGGKVRLHPSAMLAALIWTLFMASEDLVMLLPEENTLDADDLLDFSNVISADIAHHLFEMETADLGSLGVPEALRENQEETNHGTSDGQLQMREVMVQQGLALHQNAYAMGLSTIAIAMGFMSEAVLLDNQRKALEGLKQIGFIQYAAEVEAGPQVEQVVSESGDPLLKMLAEFLGLDLSLNTETAEASAGKQETQLSQDDILLTEIAEGTTPTTSKVNQTVVNKVDEAELSEPPIKMDDGDVDAQNTLIAMTMAEQEAEAIIISDILNGKHQMEEFQLGQTKIKASFDVTKSDAFSLSDYLYLYNRKTDHRTFDDRAQSFIDYIQSKETEVGIITFGDEIIMIDRDAFKHDGAETYTFSWETNDGQVISMIGLRSEFQEFDLIA